MISRKIMMLLTAFCFVSVSAFAQQDKSREVATANQKTIVPSWAMKTSTGEAVFTNPMEMPRFPGCEELAKDERHPCSINKLMEFVGANVRYPEAAKAEGVQGTVLVEFIVDTKGKVIEPKVKKSVSPSLDAEAIRVINSMPRWIPGKEEGTIVNSLMSFPIKFKLASESETK